MRTLFRNALMVVDGQTRQGALLCGEGRILDLDPPLTAAADEVVEASGLWLLPGVVDDQVHFREPGLTHKEDLWHATRACARGGVTSFLEMPNTVPTTTTQERLLEKLALARQKCLVNFGFYIGATCDNLRELQRATRTPGIKIFIGSSTGDLLVDDQGALEQIFAETRLPICAHCEDEATVRRNQERFRGVQDVAVHSQIRDHAAAIVATRRALDLARRHRHPFHVLHISTAAEVDLLQPADGLITGEVCPHHLWFTTADYARLGSLVKMNPSLKTAADAARLWQAVAAGEIQVIATDHAPHTLEEKQLPYPQCPSGLPAVENSLSLMLTAVHRGQITLERVVQAMCEAPARVWNMVGKGRLAPGYAADLVLVDPQQRRVIRNAEQQTKSRWSPWDGVEVCGIPLRTWVGGETVYRWTAGGEWFAAEPHGREIEYDLELGGYFGGKSSPTPLRQL